MPLSRLICAFVVLLAALPALAAEQVPFKGTWIGSTVSATPVGESVVLVVSSGTGITTHLGKMVMTTPHLSYLDTFVVEGTQVFTAANGDILNATITGQFVPNAEGNLEATLIGLITGGTGRFEGASGTYEFHIIARPAAFGFDSTATFDGTISTAGSTH
jgi:hypothetical protein